MPKGVMWRQDDLFRALDRMSRSRLPPPTDLADVVARLDRPGPANLPAAPLMHGTGLFNAFSTLCIGGSIVTLAGRHFDPVEVLDTVERERVKSMTIVGDAFARPILRALDAAPERWDVSSLRVIVSSGVMWSKETKDGLLRHNDRLILVDTLGSSEAIGMATSATTADAVAASATFRMAPATRVLTEAGDDVVPGSNQLGLVAMSGPMPLGYYKDPDKSAATFRIIDGVRYTIPGDWATVDDDGTVRLLGRGSQCINSGGEKVYPEEVEEVLKSHPTVADAAVVGVPRRTLRGSGPRRGPAGRRHGCRRGDAHRARQAAARRLQGTEAGDQRDRPRPRTERQARLRRHQGDGATVSRSLDALTKGSRIHE